MFGDWSLDQGLIIKFRKSDAEQIVLSLRLYEVDYVQVSSQS